MTIILVFFILLLFGLPMCFSMIGSVLYFITFESSIPSLMIPQKMVVQLDSYSLMALPFFLLMGELMNTGKITDRIFLFARRIVGHIKGGLGHVNVLASIIFSGMSGAMAADAAGLGLVEIKAMREAGFDDDFAAAVTASSSIIGPIIPPSIMMVIYGYMVGESISRLFLAGFIPGLLLGLSLMVIIYFISKRRNYPVDPAATIKEILVSFKDSFLALMLPVLVIAGILTGIITATEAAVFGANYALILSIFVYKEITWKQLGKIFLRVSITSSTILILISAASPLGWFLAAEQVPQTLTRFFLSISENPIVIMLLINALLLILGTFLETSSIMILTIPIMIPIVRSIGVDTIHFGIILILNLLLGTLTPPFGLGLFIMSKITGLAPLRVFKAAIPFAIAILVCLILIIYIPEISLTLPKVLFKG